MSESLNEAKLLHSEASGTKHASGGISDYRLMDKVPGFSLTQGRKIQNLHLGRVNLTTHLSSNLYSNLEFFPSNTSKLPLTLISILVILSLSNFLVFGSTCLIQILLSLLSTI